jgi:hypothetical protein
MLNREQLRDDAFVQQLAAGFAFPTPTCSTRSRTSSRCALIWRLERRAHGS